MLIAESDSEEDTVLYNVTNGKEYISLKNVRKTYFLYLNVKILDKLL